MAEKIAFGESAEMYLKSIHELADSQRRAHSTLAERLGITTVSAGEMIRRLQEQAGGAPAVQSVALTAAGGAWHPPFCGGSGCGSASCRFSSGSWDRLYELACQLEHPVGAEVTGPGRLPGPAYCPLVIHPHSRGDGSRPSAGR
jgi:hypothetical protein